jgi:TPR repeat protein
MNDNIRSDDLIKLLEKKKIFKKSFILWNKCAEKGNTEGMWRTGKCNWSGWGVKWNQKEGKAILEKASKKDSPSSLFFLSRCYFPGSKEEILILKTLVDHNQPAGLWEFGWRMYHGKGLLKNQIESRKMMIKAAENGWKFHAEWIYRIILDGGFGFQQSMEIANKYLDLAKKREKFDEEVLFEIISLN